MITPRRPSSLVVYAAWAFIMLVFTLVANRIFTWAVASGNVPTLLAALLLAFLACAYALMMWRE